MNSVEFRELSEFPEPAFTALRVAAFSDFGVPSQKLADVLSLEAEVGASRSTAEPSTAFKVGAFVGGALVGWTFARGESGGVLHMVNSGVAIAERRKGIYKQLVGLTIEHAKSYGYTRIRSRHVPTSNAVIIPKLSLGFHVSGFEYSEVYGPLVQLSFLVNEHRRELYRERAGPIVPLPRGA